MFDPGMSFCLCPATGAPMLIQRAQSRVCLLVPRSAVSVSVEPYNQPVPLFVDCLFPLCMSRVCLFLDSFGCTYVVFCRLTFCCVYFSSVLSNEANHLPSLAYSQSHFKSVKFGFALNGVKYTFYFVVEHFSLSVGILVIMFV